MKSAWKVGYYFTFLYYGYVTSSYFELDPIGKLNIIFIPRIHIMRIHCILTRRDLSNIK